jgi:hypothetical protein
MCKGMLCDAKDGMYQSGPDAYPYTGSEISFGISGIDIRQAACIVAWGLTQY